MNDINEFIETIEDFKTINVQRDFNVFDKITFNKFSTQIEFTYLNTQYTLNIGYKKTVIKDNENIQTIFNFQDNNRSYYPRVRSTVGSCSNGYNNYTIFPDLNLNGPEFSSLLERLLKPYNVTEVTEYFLSADLNDPIEIENKIKFNIERKLKNFKNEFNLTPVYISKRGSDCEQPISEDDGEGYMWLCDYGLTEDDVIRIGNEICRTIDMETLYPTDTTQWILDTCESNVYAYPSINDIGLLYFEDESEALMFSLTHDKEEE